MPSRLDIAIDRLTRGMAYAATGAGILLAGFVALSAFMRYLIGAPFAFTEEFVGLLFSAMVFLALPWCTHAGSHIRVTLLTDNLPPGWRRWSDLASTAFTVAFCLAFGWFSFEFAWTSYALNARSDIGRIPLWPWMMAMPAACLFMGVAAILRHRRAPPDQGGGSAV